jgi:hypothetical protein
MQAVRPMHPKFDPLGMQFEAAPVRRARYFSGMLLGESLEVGFQLLTASERAALLRNGGADLAVARPAVKVLVHIGCLHPRYRSLHPYLPVKGLPIETNRCPRIGLELPSFPAFGVGKEAEAALIRAFHQHHADAGLPPQCRSGQSRSVGIVRLAPLRLLEPQAEELEWITVLPIVHISMVAWTVGARCCHAQTDAAVAVASTSSLNTSPPALADNEIP